MFREKRLRKKIHKYQQQCLDDPSNITLQFRLAKLYLKLGEIENAVDLYHQIAQIIRDSEGHLSDLKVSDQLIKIYQQVIAIAPFDGRAYQGLGEEYCRRGEFSKALHLYTSFLHRLIRDEKYPEALTQCVNVLILDPNRISVRETYAELLCLLDMPEKCAAELKEIAGLYLLQNKPEEAFSCYFRALELTPLDPDLREKLSKVRGMMKSSEPISLPAIGSFTFPEKPPLVNLSPSLEREQLEKNLKRILESKERTEKLLVRLESLQSDQDNWPLQMIVKQRIADLEAVEMELRGQING